MTKESSFPCSWSGPALLLWRDVHGRWDCGVG